MRRGRRLSLLGVPVVIVLSVTLAIRAQEPSPPTAAPETAAPASANTPPKVGASGYTHAHDYLIHGTVFTEKALAFPNVELHIRRAGEKKYRWQGITNSRGEFAMRVPKGSEYEMLVRTKGFKDQVRKIDAKSGAAEENATFRMQPVTGSK